MNDLLFCGPSLRDELANHTQKCQEEIDALSENQALNTSPADLARYFVEKYTVGVLGINEPHIQTEYGDIQIDVSHDIRFDVYDRNRPRYVSGTRFTFFIPLTGEEESGQLLFCSLSSINFNPPRAALEDHHLVFRYDRTVDNREEIPGEFQRDKDNLKKHLSRLARDINAYNESLPGMIEAHIEARRQKLLQDRNLAEHLGFPLRRRLHAPATYVVPEVKRRVMPSLPVASAAPYTPEPALDKDEYEHILSVCRNMVQVMEHSPRAFQDMQEEDLRFHFLVHLNGQYEGQATGETFNYEGKTDILIRMEGKNIFIAECKFWDGPASLTKALDQLLGYASWRDTHTALLLFNRNKNLTKVLQCIPGVMEEHPHCKRAHDYGVETDFRYTFGHRDDTNRELLLTVLVFDVPT